MEAFIHLYPCLIKSLSQSWDGLNHSITECNKSCKRLGETFQTMNEILEGIDYENCDCE